MTDPAYLLDSTDDDFERALLGSAKRDVGSQAAKARCIAAISPAAALLATSQSSNAAALFSVVKGLGLGLVLGAVASGVAVVATTERSPSATIAPNGNGRPGARRTPAAASSTAVELPPVAKASHAQASPSEVSARPPSPGTRASTPSALVAKAQSPITPALATPLGDDLASAPNTSPSHAALQDRSLELEVRALDRARRELAAGNARIALEALTQYQQEFPHGLLLPESIFLRVQALIAAGQRAEAGALGRRFLATRSAGADARKLNQLLAQEQLR
jgi:hypothetical protein